MRGLARHRAGDRDAPALPAGQLRRHPIDVLAEADEPQHFLDPRVDLVERQIRFFVELVADVLAHRQRVEERALLEDHAEVGADRHQLLFRHGIDSLAVHPDHPLSGFSSPRISFRIVDFPAPLAPRMIFVCPVISVKLTSMENHLLVERQRHAVEAR